MRLPAFPDDRHRALVTDRLSRLGRARAGPEEAPCLPEPRPVPDLGERRGARLPIGQRQPAHVVLAIEGAAARRYATVVVHDGGVPEKQAREGLDVSHREPPLALSVPLVADDPALLDRDADAEVASHLLRPLDVLDVVREDVEAPDHPRRRRAEPALRVEDEPAVLHHQLEVAADAVLLVRALLDPVDRDTEDAQPRGDEPLGLPRVERDAEV